MVFQFDDLDQVLFFIDAGEDDPAFLELFAIGIVELEAVTVALRNFPLAVDTVGFGSRPHQAGHRAETHRAAFPLNLFLLFQQANHRMRCFRIEFGAVGPFAAEHVAGKLNARDLHPQAEAEVRDFLLTGVSCGGDLALDAAIAKAAGHEHTVDFFQQGSGPAPFNLLRIDADHVDPGIVVGARVRHGLVDAFVGILQLDVFADHCDGEFEARMDHGSQEFLPGVHVRRAIAQPEMLANEVVDLFPAKHHGYFINGVFNVLLLDDGLDGDVAKH